MSDSDDGPDVLEEEHAFSDSEDDSDSQSEEEMNIRPKKRKKGSGMSANYFVDMEAEEDEDEEEEDYDDDEEIDGRKGRKWVDPLSSQPARTRHRELDILNKPEAELERILQERYGDGNDSEEEDMGTSVIKQQSLLPSVRDPKLWMIKCKPGREKRNVMILMQKFINKENDPDRLQIKSVIYPEHLKGYIYVEAEKEAHVKNAISGMRDLQQWEAKLVPIKEMPDVLAVTRHRAQLQRGGWVRIKRGVYRGDLAQVWDVDEARGRVTVRVIPRLPLGPSLPTDDKRKRANRPAARFFNPDEIMRERLDRRVDPVTKEAFYLYEGDRYKDGFLLKAMNIKSLDTINIIPTIEETQKFQDRPEADDGGDISATASLPPIPKRKALFVKGDTVKVIEGDLKHLMGVVESVENDTVMILPKHEDLHDLLAFPASQLQKYFNTGDHVKVMTGPFEGETGLIVRVEEGSVVIFSDMTSKELKVQSQDIQEASDVTSGKLQLGIYELHDLVQINPQTVGVIVKVERDSFKILDNNGNLQTVSLANVGGKRNYRDASSFDVNQNPITVGDVVKVIDGRFKGRQGTVRHLHRYFAFLHSRDMLENSGIFVVRTSALSILGGRRPTGPSGVPQSPRHMFGNAGLRSPARFGGDRGGYGTPFVANRRLRNDELIHSTVLITRGKWKGYVGIVKDATESTARVELHTNCKIVTLPRDQLQKRDEPIPAEPLGMATPMHESINTPMRIPNTPMRTPVHGTAWDPSVPSTPGRSWDGYTPDYGISTPGGYQPSGGFTPFSPSTRPYETPGEMAPTTPGAFTPGYDSTPGFTPGYTEQHTPQDINTPYGSTPYHPTTPGTPGVDPMTPHTPGTPSDAYEADGREDANWQTTDIEVTVTSDSFRNGQFVNSCGIVREVLGDGSCRVILAEQNDSVVIPSEALEPVVPTQKGNVKVIRGEWKGNTGVLIGIDGADGIVKMSSNMDIKILDLHHLANFHPS